MKKKFFKKQHEQLNHLITSHPEIKHLIFQSKPLEWHATDEGLSKLIEAVDNEWLDPIALNHNIKRYRINNYSSDLIWDYPEIDKKINFDDYFIRELNSSCKNITEEVKQVFDFLKKFPDSDDLTNASGQWNFIPFYEKDGSAITEILDKCPVIKNLLAKQNINTDLGFVFVSSLTSKSRITAHTGSTALRKRYHLPLIVPKAGQSKIRIGDEWINWTVGKAFSFYDAVEHEVIHGSHGDRILLIVDVWPETLPLELVKTLKLNKQVFQYATESATSVALND